MDYSKIGEVKIPMEGYLREVLYNLPEEINGRDETPVATHLFKVRSREGQVFLDEPRAHEFHHYVAKLLFTSTICRKDIQTAVAFLTMRVKAPDDDDWKKLLQLMQYIKCTIRLPLILSADKLNIIKWWVDASYAAHDDMCGNTGAIMSLGRRLVFSMSKNQN